MDESISAGGEAVAEINRRRGCQELWSAYPTKPLPSPPARYVLAGPRTRYSETAIAKTTEAEPTVAGMKECCFCGCGREIGTGMESHSENGRLLDEELEQWFLVDDLVSDQAAAVSFVNDGITFRRSVQAALMAPQRWSMKKDWCGGYCYPGGRDS